MANTDEMTTEAVRSIVQDIFRDVLGQPELVLSDALTAADVEGWDSFTHINLIAAIEAHYRVRFSLGELDQLMNVGDILELIKKKAH